MVCLNRNTVCLCLVGRIAQGKKKGYSHLFHKLSVWVDDVLLTKRRQVTLSRYFDKLFIFLHLYETETKSINYI